MFNGCSVIQIRKETDFFFTKSCLNLEKENGVPNLIIHIFLLIGLLKKAKKYRKFFREEILGKFDDTMLPPNPRTRKIYDKERWTGYEVVLDVYPNLFASGILLIPKDIKPGEKRPVVVCQHGRNDIPQKLVEGNYHIL